MRFSVIIPSICALAAFVLSILCLFAGSRYNFMQDFDIVTLNTSGLGHNISPTSSGASSSPTSIGSWLTNLAQNATDDIEGEFDDIRNDITDKLSEKLGIHQWYSMHMMTMCMGTFSPNATAKGASRDVSSCTNVTAMYHFDPTSQLEMELNSGPLAGRVNLTDLGYSDDIRNGIRALNVAMSAMFVVYCIGAAAAGLSVIFSLVSFCFTGRLSSLFNFLLALLAFLALGISSGIVTAIIVKAANLANKYGNEFGLYAYKGRKFLAITWAATAAMLLATVAWVAIFCVGRKTTRMREVIEKPV